MNIALATDVIAFHTPLLSAAVSGDVFRATIFHPVLSAFARLFASCLPCVTFCRHRLHAARPRRRRARMAAARHPFHAASKHSEREERVSVR